MRLQCGALTREISFNTFPVKDIVSLEKIQRRASRLALGQNRGEMDYEERCSILKWSPLKNRVLQIYIFLSNLEFQDFFQFATQRTKSNHNYKLKFQASSCNCYKYSFLVRIVKEWNDLPEWVVEAENILHVLSVL